MHHCRSEHRACDAAAAKEAGLHSFDLSWMCGDVDNCEWKYGWHDCCGQVFFLLGVATFRLSVCDLAKLSLV